MFTTEVDSEHIGTSGNVSVAVVAEFQYEADHTGTTAL